MTNYFKDPDTRPVPIADVQSPNPKPYRLRTEIAIEAAMNRKTDPETVPQHKDLTIHVFGNPELPIALCKGSATPPKF